MAEAEGFPTGSGSETAGTVSAAPAATVVLPFPGIPKKGVDFLTKGPHSASSLPPCGLPAAGLLAPPSVSSAEGSWTGPGFRPQTQT